MDNNQKIIWVGMGTIFLSILFDTTPMAILGLAIAVCGNANLIIESLKSRS
jgi:hypothetical protein